MAEQPWCSEARLAEVNMRGHAYTEELLEVVKERDKLRAENKRLRNKQATLERTNQRQASKIERLKHGIS
jgi:regulator of replication initiation timing